jgi:MFS superfamily sulfate permease-like transporter
MAESTSSPRGSGPSGGLLVDGFHAPLFFLNAERIRERVEQTLHDSPGEERFLVLDFEGVDALDATALDVMVELVATAPAEPAPSVAGASGNRADRRSQRKLQTICSGMRVVIVGVR